MRGIEMITLVIGALVCVVGWWMDTHPRTGRTRVRGRILRGQQGFTLMELLIVTVVLGAMGFIVIRLIMWMTGWGMHLGGGR
jgi:prepilin-type N-terminal cleavage/methylation domain-containing protein